MKHIQLALMAIVLCTAFIGCKKNPQENTPKIVDSHVETTPTTATFTWTVEWVGKRISVVEVSEHEDMSDSQFYGSEEELNKADFKVTVTDLQPSSKYYYRYWVWNSNYVDAKFVMATEGFSTVPQQQQLSGAFSISYSRKVYFSQGNLQYRASDKRWRFATHQYDYIGASNNNISHSYDDWIDLFGWGTSGWNNGNVYYKPYHMEDNGDSWNGYGYGPTDGTSYDYDLTGSYANADWGVYNKIYNGGNVAGQWRTLTNNEWYYVIEERSGAAKKYGHGRVNGVYGIILLPDSWTLPEGLSFTSGDSYWSNVYTKEQWSQMEDNGAVFLPAAGYRDGSSMSDAGSEGYYWSTTHYTYNHNQYAHYLRFKSNSLFTSHSSRYYGYSVRLVRSAQ